MLKIERNMYFLTATTMMAATAVRRAPRTAMANAAGNFVEALVTPSVNKFKLNAKS